MVSAELENLKNFESPDFEFNYSVGEVKVVPSPLYEILGRGEGVLAYALRSCL
jgi:hypothetical protein